MTLDPNLHRSRVQRRLNTGNGYFEAAKILKGKLIDTGPSIVVLEVLAFEVLLKALLFAYQLDTSGGHDYFKLWSKLPERIRSEVITYGQLRFAGHADYSDPQKILENMKRAFQNYRYAYEVNEQRSADEIALASKNWDDPDFEFHPLETEGLILGLQQQLQNWLEQK